jgi:glycosyltransferase involved in cell wall biosynthesis
MDAMKVLYFHQHFSTPDGSTGNRSYEMARRLLDRGHQVTMVCGSYTGGVTGLTCAFDRGSRRGIVDGIHVIEFDLAYSNKDNLLKRSWLFLRFVWRSLILVFKETYDLVFASSTPLTAGLPGVVARWIRRKPFVFEVRDLWPELPKAMGVLKNPGILFFLRQMERLIYRSAHQIIALSPGIVDGIVKHGIAKNRVPFIPNACDFSLFDKEEAALERPKGVSHDDLMLVYTGTHGLANNLDAVLDVAEELMHRKCVDIKFVLIGQGKLKTALQLRVKNAKLENVIFLEPVSKPALARLMKSADLGMQILANIPAFYDGTSPNKFFDYIACGLPVINNYPGWLAELIVENDCGYTVEPENSVAFANVLEKIASDKMILHKKGMHARMLAEENFDRIKLADQWVTSLEASFQNPKLLQENI